MTVNVAAVKVTPVKMSRDLFLFFYQHKCIYYIVLYLDKLIARPRLTPNTAVLMHSVSASVSVQGKVSCDYKAAQ